MKTKIKLGTQTGSFMNFMMGNNSTLPEVGKGATMLHWTDRTAYQVIKVSADKKEAVIQAYSGYCADELTDIYETIVWRNGAWRRVSETIIWASDDKYEEWRKLPEAERDKYFNGYGSLLLLEGITKVKREYPKVNIIWGVIDPYYDLSF